MKWAMVMVGVLVLSTCSSTESAEPPTGDEPTGTIVVEESTTSTEPTTTTEPPTTAQPEEVPDLSGIWDGTKIVGGRTERGTVLISQTGMTFTLSFSEGFECDPADACEFDGTVAVLSDPDSGDLTYLWMASNAGSVADGGTYESSFGLQSFSDTYPEGDDPELPASVDPLTGEEPDTSDMYVGIGQSIFRGEGLEMEWETYLLLQP